METLLIVDDDVVFSRVLHRAMSARNYEVRISNSLADASDAVSKLQPHFVLLDLNINGENGVSLIPQIKAANEKCKIVVLTSYGTIRSAVWAARNGASDYVTKPADADQLDHVLRRCDNVKTPLPAVLHSPEYARETHIVEFFEKNDRRVATTARMLGLHRRTLQRILERLGMGGNGPEFARRATSIGRAKRIMRLWTTVLAKQKMPARLGTRPGLRQHWVDASWHPLQRKPRHPARNAGQAMVEEFEEQH